ncbi:type IV secretion system protein VirB10, partial [Brevundimonas abyssalis]
ARRALAESARRAPVLAYSRGGQTAPAAPPPGTASRVTLAAGAPDGGGSSLERLRQATPIGRVSAGRLPDRRFLITAGAVIPCILETAMDSAAPGQVRCVVPRDVYSDDGAVVLLDRGSRILGEYRSALERGRGRLFVLWTRAVTPDGVAIALASPAADALGRAGFDGRIDSHFWQRFGGALLLSAVEGVSSAAADAARDPAAVRRPSGAAASALEHSADIPPTLRKDQGAEVSIFVAQDLDFSGVYGLGAS